MRSRAKDAQPYNAGNVIKSCWWLNELVLVLHLRATDEGHRRTLAKNVSWNLHSTHPASANSRNPVQPTCFGQCVSTFCIHYLPPKFGSFNDKVCIWTEVSLICWKLHWLQIIMLVHIVHNALCFDLFGFFTGKFLMDKSALQSCTNQQMNSLKTGAICLPLDLSTVPVLTWFSRSDMMQGCPFTTLQETGTCIHTHRISWICSNCCMSIRN